MGFGIDRLLGGSHLLKALGVDSGGLLGQLDQLTDQLPFLNELRDSFSLACGGMSPQMLAGMLQSGGIGMPLFMPPPNMGMCRCPGQFAMPQTIDFGAAPGGMPFGLGSIMARRQGAKFERMLAKNPFARAQFEMAIGGRIIPDGCKDGRITVQPFGPGFFPAGGMDNAAFGACNMMFAQMARAAGYQAGFQQGALAQQQQAFGGGSLFQGFMLQGLQHLLQGAMLPAQLLGLGAPGGGPGALAPAFGGAPQVGAFNGAGAANQAAQGIMGNGQQFAPGTANATQGAFGLGKNDGSDVAGVLNDPSLTVEDKVCLMIMLIMKKMDEDIEKQAQEINKMQQQQNKGGGGKGGGKGGGGGGGGDKSIYVETMKLKRLIDKRSQMFDMLRQIIDKYNQTAKGIIDSIGR